MRSRDLLTLLALALALAACGGNDALAPVQDGKDLSARQPSGEVQPGDTLYSFAWRYGFDYREIAEWNGLGAPYRVRAGDLLRLSPGGVTVRQPGTPAPVESGQVTVARAPAPIRGATSVPPRPPLPASAAPRISSPPPSAAPEHREPVRAPSPPKSVPVKRSPSGWYWPVKGKVAQGFDPGRPGGQGIRFATARNAPVAAARDGKVVYVGGGLPGYGKLIIVKHTEDLLTAYGYLGKTFVKEGEAVAGGQAIAIVTSSGTEGAPKLHFEIRRDGKPTDPLAFLSG